MKVKSEDHAEYVATKKAEANDEQAVINRALAILRGRMVRGDIISSPQTLVNYLRLKTSDKRREVFGVVFLNAKNELIADEIIQEGTIDQTAVYPREIARACLLNDAASVILYHNHPSGEPAPSVHDTRLTGTLKEALKVFSIRVHDHIIVGRYGYYSFSENGGL